MDVESFVAGFFCFPLVIALFLWVGWKLGWFTLWAKVSRKEEE